MTLKHYSKKRKTKRKYNKRKNSRRNYNKTKRKYGGVAFKNNDQSTIIKLYKVLRKSHYIHHSHEFKNSSEFKNSPDITKYPNFISLLIKFMNKSKIKNILTENGHNNDIITEINDTYVKLCWTNIETGVELFTLMIERSGKMYILFGDILGTGSTTTVEVIINDLGKLDYTADHLIDVENILARTIINNLNTFINIWFLPNILANN